MLFCCYSRQNAKRSKYLITNRSSYATKDKNIPEPKSEEVVVEIQYAALLSCDINNIKNEQEYDQYFSGKIFNLGTDVTDYEIDQEVYGFCNMAVYGIITTYMVVPRYQISAAKGFDLKIACLLPLLAECVQTISKLSCDKYYIGGDGFVSDFLKQYAENSNLIEATEQDYNESNVAVLYINGDSTKCKKFTNSTVYSICVMENMTQILPGMNSMSFTYSVQHIKDNLDIYKKSYFTKKNTIFNAEGLKEAEKELENNGGPYIVDVNKILKITESYDNWGDSKLHSSILTNTSVTNNQA